MAKVTKSRRYQRFESPDEFNLMLAEAARHGLVHYLMALARRDWTKRAWAIGLTDRYRRWKTGEKRRQKGGKSDDAARSKRKDGKEFDETPGGDKGDFRNRRGVDDLFLYGNLRREFLVEAPKRCIITRGQPAAETYIDGKVVPYAAALQYGRPEINLRPRRYIRLEENRVAIARSLRRWLGRQFRIK